MKISRIDRKGNRREALLKEYFLTASLIALFKRVSEEAAKAVPHHSPALIPAKVSRRDS